MAAAIALPAGVASAIVPSGLCAMALVSLVSHHHLLVFSLGGAVMLIGGLAVLAGWKPRLLVPAHAAPPRQTGSPPPPEV